MGEAGNALGISGEVEHVKSVNANCGLRVARERCVPRRSHSREEITYNQNIEYSG